MLVGATAQIKPLHQQQTAAVDCIGPCRAFGGEVTVGSLWDQLITLQAQIRLVRQRIEQGVPVDVDTLLRAEWFLDQIIENLVGKVRKGDEE